MVFLYPVGLTCLYFTLLYSNRISINPPKLNRHFYTSRQDFAGTGAGAGGDSSSMSTKTGKDRQIQLSKEKKEMQRVSGIDEANKDKFVHAFIFLYQQYDRKYWFWEIIETSRRLFLTAAISFVQPGSKFQYFVGMVIALIFINLIS